MEYYLVEDWKASKHDECKSRMKTRVMLWK